MAGTPVRLFLTCWLIYSLHLATNTVRELFLAMAIGDHFSFRVDEYAGMHADLFESPGRGWHINSNPGASMAAAIPYAAARPVVDLVVNRVNRQRAAAGSAPPKYDSPWPLARAFFEEAWRRGFDIKFGLASVVTQTLCMAPLSALGVVAMFRLLRQLFSSERTALWLALVYAFGTPVFFRTGYLNHNLMLGHFAFLGFLALWNPLGDDRRKFFLAGLAGGAALLLDYTGVVLLGGLLMYGLARVRRVPLMIWYGLGALGPILLLWFYQWVSFGHPLYPAQHWMPATKFSGAGYQGIGLPQPDLLWLLLWDYRYGLFLACPLALLALAAPFTGRWPAGMGRTEMAALLGIPGALWLFSGCINYTRLQYNTGFRYLAPALPFLFVAIAMVLIRLPRRLAYLIGVVAVAQGWAMAMYRDVERGLGLAEPIVQILRGGVQLPALTVLSRVGGVPGPLSVLLSPLVLFAVAAAILWGVWAWRPRVSR